MLHPKFGWVEKDWVPHLDRGELPAPGSPGKPTRWLPAAEADALRREFDRGWQIRTEHFAILTNVPLAEAIDFGRHLEAFDELFTSLMADVIGPADLPLAKLAKDPKLSPDKLPPKKPHRVNYYADKEEYVDVLSPLQGADIRTSLGIYLPAKELRAKEGISFFYRDPGGQLAETETLFHEVSHQLLFEMTPGKYDPERANYWVYEGLGTYFETVRPQPDGSLRVGGLVGKRIAVAQDRVIGRREFVPIGRMASYNKFLFNAGNGGDIYLNYAEAMALVVFFMDADAGRYREDFLEYARDVYKGRIKPGAGKIAGGPARRRRPDARAGVPGLPQAPRGGSGGGALRRADLGRKCERQKAQGTTQSGSLIRMCVVPSFGLRRGRARRRPYSPTYGISAMKRARLTASLEARWNAAQLPLRFRENILLWFVQSFFRRPMSL